MHKWRIAAQSCCSWRKLHLQNDGCHRHSTGIASKGHDGDGTVGSETSLVVVVAAVQEVEQ
jgi:hypothetical protein